MEKYKYFAHVPNNLNNTKFILIIYDNGNISLYNEYTDESSENLNLIFEINDNLYIPDYYISVFHSLISLFCINTESDIYNYINIVYILCNIIKDVVFHENYSYSKNKKLFKMQRNILSNTKIVPLKDKIIDLKNANYIFRDKISLLNHKISLLNDQISSQNNEMIVYEGKISFLNNEISVYQEKISSLNNENMELKNEMENIILASNMEDKNKIEILNYQLMDKNNEILNLKDELNTIQSNINLNNNQIYFTKNKKKDDENSKIKSLELLVENKDTEIDSLNLIIQKLNDENKRLKDTNKDLKNNLIKINKEIEIKCLDINIVQLCNFTLIFAVISTLIYKYIY